MDFGNILLDPAKAFAAVLGLALLGLLIWWLLRKRQNRVWLPTIRVMTLEARLMPKLLLRPPPLIAFLSFLAAAMMIVGFALRPRTLVFTPFEPNQARIHIFTDLSPSVSAQISIEDYALKIGGLWSTLAPSGRVTLSLSSSPEIFEPKTEDEVKALVVRTGFHRGGLKLGAALKRLVEDLGEVDRLFIASDRDAHAWTGFNWRYLLDDMLVVFFDLSGESEPQNLFINDARALTAANAATYDWDVEIARRGPGDALDGKLTAVYGDSVLATAPFHVAPEKQRITTHITFPATAVKQALAAAKDAPLVFRIEVEGKDALKLDDELKTKLSGLEQEAIIVADSSGERLLNDPAHQLTIALEVLGFRARRFDFVKEGGGKLAEKPFERPFWVLLGGAGESVDRFCPKPLSEARRAFAKAAKAGAGGPEGSTLAQGEAPKVWLVPAAMDADWRELCRCYARLAFEANDAEDGGSGEKDFCANVSSRAQYLGVLPSLGAKQIGGAVGDEAGAVAFSGRDAVTGMSILAFTVPLDPSPQSGLSHAQLPLLMRELLTFQGILEPRGGGGIASWPRVDDVATTSWPKAPAERARLEVGNVPFGESLLAEVDEQDLPPRWSAQQDLAAKELASKKDREDPLPWLRLAALVVVLAAALEGLFSVASRFVRAMGRKPSGQALAFLLAALGALFAAPRADAKVEFGIIGYLDGVVGLTTLAREVSHRTSIELTAKPGIYAAPGSEALLEPWLWAKDLSAIAGKDGRLKGELSLWLKRGGFLIVESNASPAALAKLTTGLAPSNGLPAAVPGDASSEAASGEGIFGEAGWMPLPPDHELMRSFYLLDAMPSCGDGIWRGFHYDGRLAILLIPYDFLASLKDRPSPPACATPPDHERSVRIFVNMVMVALATDYKKDQIHLPEILKRLR